MNRTRRGAPVQIARCQSVDRHRGSLLDFMRWLVHLRYIRAVVLAACLVAIVGSGAALVLAIRHDVSAGAVVRYFTRPRSDSDDLGRLLRRGSTVFHLEPLLNLPPGVNPGGLVYEDEHGLIFYTHSPRREPERIAEFEERRELFERLAPYYWRADLPRLADAINRPSMRQALIARGALIKDLYAFQRYRGQPVDRRTRTDLLRAAARHMQLVVPYIREPMKLDFVEQLRFYDHHRPSGRFVGLWEVAAPDPFGGIDAEFAHDRSQTHHYVVLSRYAERTRISDFYQGVRRDYEVKQVGHPSGRTLYRLSSVPAS